MGLTTSYAYNANNTVATVTKPSGLQIQKSYDQALRLIQETDPYATTGFAYDKNGQLIQATDNSRSHLTSLQDAFNLERISGLNQVKLWAEFHCPFRAEDTNQDTNPSQRAYLRAIRVSQ